MDFLMEALIMRWVQPCWDSSPRKHTHAHAHVGRHTHIHTYHHTLLSTTPVYGHISNTIMTESVTDLTGRPYWETLLGDLTGKDLTGRPYWETLLGDLTGTDLTGTDLTGRPYWETIMGQTLLGQTRT